LDSRAGPVGATGHHFALIVLRLVECCVPAGNRATTNCSLEHYEGPLVSGMVCTLLRLDFAENRAASNAICWCLVLWHLIERNIAERFFVAQHCQAPSTVADSETLRITFNSVTTLRF